MRARRGHETFDTVLKPAHQIILRGNYCFTIKADNGGFSRRYLDEDNEDAQDMILMKWEHKVYDNSKIAFQSKRNWIRCLKNMQECQGTKFKFTPRGFCCKFIETMSRMMDLLFAQCPSHVSAKKVNAVFYFQKFLSSWNCISCHEINEIMTVVHRHLKKRSRKDCSKLEFVWIFFASLLFLVTRWRKRKKKHLLA